jgi:hypothetical protein
MNLDYYIKNKTCPITLKRVTHVQIDPLNLFCWFRIHIGSRIVEYKLSTIELDIIDLIEKYRHILYGHIANNKLSDNNLRKPLTKYDIERIVAEGDYPQSPKELKDGLLLHILSRQQYDGQKNIWTYYENDMFAKLYFRNIEELKFYFESINSAGLVDISMAGTDGIDGFGFNLTYKGLEYLTNLHQEGKHSNKCFIAMSFDFDNPNIAKIRDSILKAIESTNFKPLIISNEHLKSDQTINDGIIAGINKSRFLIADFTEQKDGVYFESGYAAGKGLKVIYTCRKDHFKKSHFDTNHFPHILYDTPEELTKKLIDKIEAWVID